MAKTYLENMCANYGKTPADFKAEEIEEMKKVLKKMGCEDPDALQPADESFTCSICGEYFENEYSHNAYPVNDGRCCIMCNANSVIPARLAEMMKK